MNVTLTIQFEWPPGTKSRDHALRAVEAMASMIRDARETMSGDIRDDHDAVVGRYKVEFK